jgi:hypothetical protein
MKKFIYTILVLIIIVFGITLTLTYIQPLLYRKFPSDNDRHIVIMDVLNESKTNENIIVFGDSRTMFGVDTRIIKDTMSLTFNVFNLSSVGQGLYESSYFYALLDTNTKAVIQCIDPSFFSRDIKYGLQDEKAISMFLSGYRIDERTKSLIKNYNEIFDRSKFVNYFKSRSIIRSYIHSNVLRPIFDNETFNKSARVSVYFPHLYTTNQHPNYPVYEYDCSRFKYSDIPNTQLSFLSNVRDYFKIKGIEYFIVLMPVNPDECKECYQDFKEYTKMIEEVTNIRVIDITDLILDTKYFYDAMHANKDGAKIISSQIAKQLLAFKLNVDKE